MINEIKALLQIACLTAAIVVIVIAGIAFFQLYEVLGDFRESYIFQPVGPAVTEAIEPIVNEIDEELVEELIPLLPENTMRSPAVDSQDIEDNIGLGIPENTNERQDKETAQGYSVEEPETQSHMSDGGVTIQEVNSENICGRTPEIQQLLIEMLSITRCRDITGEELLRVRKLELREIPLKVGDLDGFKNLTSLTLITQEASLGLFDDLESLEYLGLGLETPPPSGLFKNLAALQRLELLIEAEPDAQALALQGLFEGLVDLEGLDLTVRNSSGDYAVALSIGSLTGMPKLQQLEVSNVSRIESGALGDLTALRSANLDAVDLPGHLTRPSVPQDAFAENPDLESVYLSGFQEISRLDFNSLDVVCRMQRNMDLMYGVEFDLVVDGKVVEVVDYDWDDETLECTLRVAPAGSENWEEVKVDVPPLPQSRRN